MIAFLAFDPPFAIEGNDPVIVQVGEIAAVFPRDSRKGDYPESTVVLRSGEKVNVGEPTKDINERLEKALRKAGGA